MRFLHITPAYPPYPSGMGHAAHEAAEGLASRGHEVHVATLADHSSLPMGDQGGTVMVHRLWSFPRYSHIAGLPWKLWSLVREPWDAVLLHMPFFGAQELLTVALLLGCKTKRLVIYYHMVFVSSGFVSFVGRISRTFFMPILFRKADAIMIASRSYAETSWLKKSWNIVEPKLIINPFGVDTERFAPKPDPAQIMKHICFVGGLDRPHYFKGLSVLLEALAGLKDRNDWVLDIVGDGDLRASYEAQARELAIHDRVNFLGRHVGELAEVFQRAYMHVVPSLDRSEAFGLVVLEAQSCGVPSIVSDLPGVRDAIQPEQTGIRVPVNNPAALRDALARLLQKPSLRNDMGNAARWRILAGFTWKRHLDVLEQTLCQKS